MVGCRPAATPIEQNHRLMADGGTPVDRESVVSQYMHDPRKRHQEAVYQIIRYLKGCPGRGLMFSRHGYLKIEGYTDADWAGALDDRKSTSGYCIFLGGNLVTWHSKKQNVAARSSAEAEYRALAQGVCEVI
ncbi:secreted RxLR effector protein 161-like [Elaeis guineensis]|uniref:secreted RxLR effector protein 161-like n=1 Tax=Elaeis guineensis var. tenera TaxID=51953 RepID=UPI003C6D2388